jgi:hypothetical protein
VFTDRLWDHREHQYNAGVGTIDGKTVPYFGQLPDPAVRDLIGTPEQWAGGLSYADFSAGRLPLHPCWPVAPGIPPLRVRQKQRVEVRYSTPVRVSQVQGVGAATIGPALVDQKQSVDGGILVGVNQLQAVELHVTPVAVDQVQSVDLGLALVAVDQVQSALGFTFPFGLGRVDQAQAVATLLQVAVDQVQSAETGQDAAVDQAQTSEASALGKQSVDAAGGVYVYRQQASGGVCGSSAPTIWRLVASGFGGTVPGLNGTWLLSFVVGNNWTAGGSGPGGWQLTTAAGGHFTLQGTQNFGDFRQYNVASGGSCTFPNVLPFTLGSAGATGPASVTITPGAG